MYKENIAKMLLDKEVVTLNPEKPYTFVSGIRSPIYCDNRLLTSHPKERKLICKAFNEIVKELEPEVIAGTASSAIAWASWIAHKLEKPMVYIRKKEKDYGQENLIEGGDIKGKKVVVIEDLVSTGGSSMNAVESCRDSGADVIAMVAIFTYEFEKAKKLFEESKCKTIFLAEFSTLTEVAAKNNFLDEDKLNMVQEWNKDPSGWGPKHGFPLGEKMN